MSIFTKIKRCYYYKCINEYFYIVKSLKSMNKDQIDDVLPGINMGISKSGNDLHEKNNINKKSYIPTLIHSYGVALVLTEQCQYFF